MITNHLRKIIRKGFPKSDYLVFSSHKTATQSIKKTLDSNGFNSWHCHRLEYLGLEEGTFKHYVNDLFLNKRKQVTIISTFREPIERHMSSFFQWYGSKPLREKEVKNEFDTIIYRSSIKELQKLLITEINNNQLVGIEESLDSICEELDIRLNDLSFDSKINKFGQFDTNSFRLILFRFDILVRNIPELLSVITRKKITVYNKNMSNSKWYYEKYNEFRRTFKLPQEIIENIYFSRRDLINLFYDDQYEDLLNAAINKYAQ